MLRLQRQHVRLLAWRIELAISALYFEDPITINRLPFVNMLHGGSYTHACARLERSHHPKNTTQQTKGLIYR